MISKYTNCLIVALAISPSAAIAAPSFADRVSAAEAVERTPEGLEYLMLLMSAIDQNLEDAMGACFTKGKVGTTDRFVVVADIQRDGTIVNVEVSPKEIRTECYRDKLSVVKAPEFTASFRKATFPIVIKSSNEYVGAP